MRSIYQCVGIDPRIPILYLHVKIGQEIKEKIEEQIMYIYIYMRVYVCVEREKNFGRKKRERERRTGEREMWG